MTRYIQDAGGQRYTPDQYRAANRNVHFSGWPSASYLASVGASIVELIDPPTQADVIAERETRLAAGFEYDFGDARGVHRIGTTPEDMRKWNDEVGPYAQALINSGSPNGEIGIVTETSSVTVTATEWQAILIAAGAFRQPIYLASFTLMTMNPIPDDFAADQYWP